MFIEREKFVWRGEEIGSKEKSLKTTVGGGVGGILSDITIQMLFCNVTSHSNRDVQQIVGV